MTSRLVIDADPGLADRLRGLAGLRMVFFAGLPGTGKSLLLHQLTHLAAARGRRVTLLQWDVARPAFEASPAGRRYPVAGGVTHPVIRAAAGLWVRRAVAAWHHGHQGADHLLIGETPLVGHRFVELARRLDDPAEPLLAAPGCRFVIAVPSVEVRRFLEGERERRAARPLHPREREDAPPGVLRDLWRDLARVAGHLGVAPRPGADAGAAGPEALPPYDPDLYRRVYEAVLRHRQVEVVSLDVILPTRALSVYDFAAAPPDLTPEATEVEACIGQVEHDHPDPAALERWTAEWWRV
jgi:hypothetical protein